MNVGAFFVVMIIANKIGSEETDDYKGLGYSMPFLGFSIAVFLVSLTGIPPTAGFIGKLYIFIALVDAKMIVVAVIALLNTVVSLYYYIKSLEEFIFNKAGKRIACCPCLPCRICYINIFTYPNISFRHLLHTSHKLCKKLNWIDGVLSAHKILPFND